MVTSHFYYHLTYPSIIESTPIVCYNLVSYNLPLLVLYFFLFHTFTICSLHCPLSHLYPVLNMDQQLNYYY